LNLFLTGSAVTGESANQQGKGCAHMTSHTFSLCICLFCFFHSTNQTFQLGKGLPSGRKKGLRHESGKPLSGKLKAGWQNVVQVLPKLIQKGKRANIPATGIWRLLTKSGD
jgi:hypothetical protein